MVNTLQRVMGMEEWYNQKYPEKYGYDMMSHYKEWLDYRSKILADNRELMAKRKRMTENGLKK